MSYTFRDFLSYRDQHNSICPEMKKFYDTTNKYHKENVKIFSVQLDDTINAILKGTNPNDISMRNKIKYHIGLLSDKNYKIQIEEFQKMHLDKNPVHMVFFIQELIEHITRCQISVRGIIFNGDTEKTIPEVCADALQSFTNKDQILEIIKPLFDYYIQDTILLNQQNQPTIDKFKGLMTCIGLLYSRGLVDDDFVFYVIKNIHTQIFDKINNNYLRDEYEVGNYYKGFEYVMTHVINTKNVKITKEIGELCKNFLKPDENRLKIFNKMAHEKLMEKLSKLF